MIRLLAIALTLALIAGVAMAEEEAPVQAGDDSQQVESEEDPEASRPRSFVAIPLIDQSPTLGTGFGGMALYFFEPGEQDQISPPSVLGVAALYSNTDSYVFAVPAKLFLKEDTWRISTAYARFRVNYDFDYDIGGGQINLVYTEIRDIFALDVSRRIYRDFYLGFLYTGWNTRFDFGRGDEAQNRFSQSLFEREGITGGFESSVGLNFSYDTRDYPYYPTRGINGSIRPKFFAEALGGDNDYTDVDYAISGFHSLNPKGILAWRVSGGNAFGDVPFSGYQTYGVRNSLRGYPAGKYRGPNMIAAQVEYRWRLRGRWGVVGFAGSGRVWGDEDETSFSNSEWLPSIGGGLRYMLLEDRKINLRIDYGWGRNGNHGLYIGLLEAF